MMLELNSVGCGIDDETLLVYVKLKDGSYDKTQGYEEHLDDCSEEWFENLDNDDFGTIKTLIMNRNFI